MYVRLSSTFFLYSSYQWFSTQCAKEGATPTASTPQVSPAPPSVQEAPSGGGGSSSSSSRHKKAKKQATKGTKERDDPEKHGAVLAHGDRGSHKHSSRSSHHSVVNPPTSPRPIKPHFPRDPGRKRCHPSPARAPITTEARRSMPRMLRNLLLAN